MTKKLIWRLDERPKVIEIAQLVNLGIITTEEARSMVIREEDEPEGLTKESGSH